MKLSGDTTSVTAFSFTAGKMRNTANCVFALQMCTFTFLQLHDIFIFRITMTLCSGKVFLRSLSNKYQVYYMRRCDNIYLISSEASNNSMEMAKIGDEKGSKTNT